MDMRVTIECRDCHRLTRGNVEMGEKSRDRVGVASLFLPPGWQVRTGKSGQWPSYNRTHCEFVCPACSKAPAKVTEPEPANDAAPE